MAHIHGKFRCVIVFARLKKKDKTESVCLILPCFEIFLLSTIVIMIVVRLNGISKLVCNPSLMQPLLFSACFRTVKRIFSLRHVLTK